MRKSDKEKYDRRSAAVLAELVALQKYEFPNMGKKSRIARLHRENPFALVVFIQRQEQIINLMREVANEERGH